MGIGTSLGAFFETELDHHAGNEVAFPEITPDKMMQDKAVGSDPKNIYDDQGNIVDYDTQKGEVPPAEGLEGISTKFQEILPIPPD